jgi:hypothetical protein
MLRSLCETVRIGGYKGIYVSVDDLDILLSRTGSEHVRYTRMRRDDTYESIRQMIDEIDSFKNIMIVFGFDRILMDQDIWGFKSYQALWMRIQNEITGERFNKFNDIVNLDRLGKEIYTEEALVTMSERAASYGNELAGEDLWHAIDRDRARALIERSALGGIGLPLMTLQALLEGDQTETGLEVQ